LVYLNFPLAFGYNDPITHAESKSHNFTTTFPISSNLPK
jgi:hypothetical protein